MALNRMKDSLDRSAYQALHVLDRARRSTLWALSPWIRSFILSRERRVCLTACLGITLAFSFSTTLPLWQLLLGPIILGIPHVIGDIRYLLIKGQLHRERLVLLAVGLPLTIYMVTGDTFFATLSIFLMSIKTTRTGAEAKLVQLSSLALLLSSIYFERYFLFIFLHAHNLIGIAFWWLWRRKKYPWEYTPLIMLTLFSALIIYLSPSNDFALRYFPGEMNFYYYSDILAGALPERWERSAVLLFAFLQSVHYLVWIRLIPEEARRQPTPRGFRSSYRALREDFGLWLLLSLCVLSLFFIGYASISPERARTDYLLLISFHGFLELAMFVYQPYGRHHDMERRISSDAAH